MFSYKVWGRVAGGRAGKISLSGSSWRTRTHSLTLSLCLHSETLSQRNRDKDRDRHMRASGTRGWGLGTDRQTLDKHELHPGGSL